MNDIKLLFVRTPAAGSAFDNLYEQYKNQSRLIDFYTNSLDELMVIAKYRVLPTPTIVFLDGEKSVGRIVSATPNANKMKKALKLLQEQ
jgi:thioredoxin-related protein